MYSCLYNTCADINLFLCVAGMGFCVLQEPPFEDS